MKFTLLFLLLFAKSCSSQENEKNEELANASNEVLIEFNKPLDNFKLEINWKLKDSVSEFYNQIIGPAKFKLSRITDSKNFEFNIENFNIEDTIVGIDLNKRFKEKKVPNVLQLENHPNIYFKDLNFDGKSEFIVDYATYDIEINKRYDSHKIYEFINDELIEINYFPNEALNWSGEIDYKNQIVITRDYYNCCSYYATYFKYDKNNKEKFYIYKTEEHIVDAINGNDEIIIEEKGKKKVTIFKKGE